MIQWLSARQAGVDLGRAMWCQNHRDICNDITDGTAIHKAAGGTSVFCASEVNIVGSSISQGMRNNVLGVLPFVSLDVVSYSSYDTMWLNGGAGGFGAALDFITAHHNRTKASPTPALFVAEYGVAQMQDTDIDHVTALIRNVNAWALSINPSSNTRRAIASFYWELFDNEVNPSPQFPGGRCNAQTGPEFNMSDLHGFWLLRPDGTQSPSWTALTVLLNSTSAVIPTPEKAICVFTPDTDLQGPGQDGEEFNATSQDDCCDICASNVLCYAAVWQNSTNQCFTKFKDGTRVNKPGVTLCQLQQDVRRGKAIASSPRIPQTPSQAFPKKSLV